MAIGASRRGRVGGVDMGEGGETSVVVAAAPETAGDDRSDGRRRPHRGGVLVGAAGCRVACERWGSIGRVRVRVVCVRNLCVNELWAGPKPISVSANARVLLNPSLDKLIST
jgi:hypothetical protein